MAPSTEPAPNYSAQTLYRFLRDDFLAAWDSLATAEPQPDARGNFLFAGLAMTMLELACRVCKRTGVHLRSLARELALEDQRYFTPMPAAVPQPRRFDLPYLSSQERGTSHVLSAIYDLVRHGLAHQNQQMPARLTDGKYLQVGISGVGDTKLADLQRGRHLSFSRSPTGDVWLYAEPGIMFLDFRRAIDRAHVFSGGHDHRFLEQDYYCNADSLAAALEAGGHASD